MVSKKQGKAHVGPVRDRSESVKHWLDLIEKHLRYGDYQSALAAVDAGLAATGGDSGLRRLRATISRALEQEDRGAPWSGELAHLTHRLDEGDLPGAAKLADQFTERWPDQPDGWSRLAECQYRLKDYEKAIYSAQRAVALKPESSQFLANLGAMQIAAGQRDLAESTLNRALQIKSDNAQALASLGRIFREREDLALAKSCYRRALDLQPEQAEFHHNLGNVLEQLGESEEAETCYRRALEIQPDLAVAANNLGVLLDAQERYDEARLLLERSIALAPNSADGYFNLGNLLRKIDEFEAATKAYERALALDPEMVNAWHNLALTQIALGWFDEAEVSHRKALEIAPNRPDLLGALGNLLGALDHFDQAAELFQQALDLEPDDVDLQVSLAGAFDGMGDYDRAEQGYRRALELGPERGKTYVSLAVMLSRQRRYPDALALVDKALQIEPESAGAYRCRARIFMESGDIEASERDYRKAVSLLPDHKGLRSDMLVAMAFTGHWTALELRKAAEEWELATIPDKDRAAALKRVFYRAPRAGRKLRLAILSAEFGQHPVAYFLRPWLRSMDREKYEIFLYSSANRNDNNAHLFEVLADSWIPLAGLSDHQAARRIREDDIDVLVETTGHDVDRRMGVIAERVAPVQCHYIGYYATTGLSQMDYFIGDSVLIPSRHDQHFTERVWRLPRTRYAYEPLVDAPEPRWWPDPDGQIWLGSFNNLVKVREASLALWAKVLHALPTARLALKDNKGASRTVQLRILKTLQAHGITADRVVFMNWAPYWHEHMAYYNRLDLALDSVPFNSATTGFDALWMGCPLVTLAGDRMAGRQAASLLTGLGRPEWIATTDDDYVQIAVDLARDRNLRRQIRETQREQMRASELCDGPGLARALSAAFDSMYERWWEQRSSPHAPSCIAC